MIAAPIPDLVSSETAIIRKQAEAIPPVSTPEAAQIAAFEVQQVVNLLEQLDGDDWTQPTDCTAWNVRDMTAHLAGACAGWASWGQFFRQTILNPHILKTVVTVDALNRRQLEDRRAKAPRDLIAELRAVGTKAVHTREKLPGLLRKIQIPAQPMPGMMSLAYLVDVIYPRDQWMHRMDICRATGKALVITPGHDERLLDLVMRDIARKVSGSYALVVNITGPLTASYRLGRGEPQAEITIDYRDMNRRASGRITPDEALEAVTIQGDRAVAAGFLRDCAVLY